MGLLGKAKAKSHTCSPDENSASVDIQALINGFHEKNPLFHCVVLRPGSGEEHGFSEMSGALGIECFCLPNRDCLLLLPGGLDMELYSHRFSNSSGSTVILQFTSDSPAFAFEQLAINNEQLAINN